MFNLYVNYCSLITSVKANSLTCVSACAAAVLDSSTGPSNCLGPILSLQKKPPFPSSSIDEEPLSIAFLKRLISALAASVVA